MFPDDSSNNVLWQSWVQSVAKPDGEYQSRNQDVAHPTLWAVSDGAGGTGFFAADWAGHLCAQLPTQPFEGNDAVIDWFDELREPFFRAKREQAEQTFADILDDYEREGSSATLLAAWPLADDQLRVLHYGDSAAFLLDQHGHLKRHTTDLITFTEPPYLLHSNENLLPDHLILETWPATEGDVLLMASDALSQWLLIQMALRDPRLQPQLQAVLETPYGLGNQIIYCQQQHDPMLTMPRLLQRLTDVCSNETAFRNFTTDLYQRGQLALDDYTLRICLRTPT